VGRADNAKNIIHPLEGEAKSRKKVKGTVCQRSDKGLPGKPKNTFARRVR
jgi:hypothetical protein